MLATSPASCLTVPARKLVKPPFKIKLKLKLRKKSIYLSVKTHTINNIIIDPVTS